MFQRIQPSATRRSEFTLGIMAAQLEQIAADNACTLLDNQSMAIAFRQMDFNVVGARRSLIDQHDLMRQFIAYTLMYRITTGTDGDDVIEFGVYLRNKKNGEVKLATNYSMGIGGHVEATDIVYYMLADVNGEPSKDESNEIDVAATIDNSCFREFCEEVTVTGTEDDNHFYQPLGFVMDSTDTKGYVGNTHVGLLYAIDMPADADFEMAEDINDRIGWFTPEGIKAFDLGPFEPWSVMVQARIDEIARELLNTRKSRIILNATGLDTAVELDLLKGVLSAV